MLKKVNIKSMGADYDINILLNGIDSVGAIIRSVLPNSKVLVVTDTNVAPIYLDKVMKSMCDMGIICSHKTVCSGEESKSISNVTDILQHLATIGMTRSDAIIALGGGVIGDLAGFVASIYLRGIPFVQIPTTLLSQVDSSVGGKVGVNIPQGKNLVGSFYQPVSVVTDLSCLQTLPDREFYGGMAEVIKYGAIYDHELFDYLNNNTCSPLDIDPLANVIARCCAIKGDYVYKDPFDKGCRMQLNFGHTVGHALEKVSGYGVYHHGEAVSIGMVVAARWGEHIGVTEKGTAEKIESILKKYHLPTNLPSEWADKLHESLKIDKKNISNHLNFIYLQEIGKAIVQHVNIVELNEWIKDTYR